MKDKKVILIAAGAVVLCGALAYSFFGSSGNDADPSRPYAADPGEAYSPSDTAPDSPTRGNADSQLGAGSSRLSGAVDSAEAEELKEEAATQEKKRKSRKQKRGYASDSEEEEEEAVKAQSGKKLRSTNKIPLGGG